MYKMRTHEFFLLSYQLGEVIGSKKYYYQILLRHLSADLSSTETKNWEKLEMTKSGWLDSLYQDMWQKVCYKSIWWEIGLLKKGLRKCITNEHFMPILRATESSCLYCKLISPKDYYSAHLSFGQCHNKNFQIFYRFCKVV